MFSTSLQVAQYGRLIPMNGYTTWCLGHAAVMLFSDLDK